MTTSCRIRSTGSRLGAVLVLLLGFGGLSGCGEDMPVASTENALVPAHAGPNTPITVNNAQRALVQAFGAFSEAIPRIAEVAAAKPAATRPASAQSITIPDLSIDGQRSGLLTISNAQVSLGISSTQTLVADLVFDDFSDDGQLFVGGPVRFELRFGLLQGLNPFEGNARAVEEFFGDLRVALTGQLGFSGTYSGTLAIDVELTVNEFGIAEMAGEVVLDGQTIELSGL